MRGALSVPITGAADLGANLARRMHATITCSEYSKTRQMAALCQSAVKVACLQCDLKLVICSAQAVRRVAEAELN